MTYCIVPADLAAELHDLLRRHFRRERDVEVIVERRSDDRRSEMARRDGGGASGSAERRRVRSPQGRRAAERRAAEAVLEEPRPWPPLAVRYADRLRLVQRVEPNGRRAEDRDGERLVAQIQAGDQDAAAVLYARYFDRVYGYLRIALGHSAPAERATQATFTSALRALPDYAPTAECPVRVWLFKLAAESAARELPAGSIRVPRDAEQVARRRAAETASDPRLGALERLDDHELLALFDRLPPAERQALMLRYMLGLTLPEIATVLGRTRQDATVLHHRAMVGLSDAVWPRGRR
jgi:RNA polymerase sigma-70 factor (ECF subfamily)